MAWFHVERDPVEEAPPLLRAASNQVVDLGIDDLQRQSPLPATQSRRRSPRQPAPPARCDCYAPRRCCARRCADLAKQHELLAAMAKQIAALAPRNDLPRPRYASASSKLVLPEAFCPVNQVEIRGPASARRFETAKISHSKNANHCALGTSAAGDQSLIGMTTNVQSSLSGCRIRQLDCCPAPTVSQHRPPRHPSASSR